MCLGEAEAEDEDEGDVSFFFSFPAGASRVNTCYSVLFLSFSFFLSLLFPNRSGKVEKVVLVSFQSHFWFGLTVTSSRKVW